MAKTRNGWGASRDAYKAKLVVERLTGVPYEGYVNDDMRRGIELEPEARTAYEFYQGVTVESAEFVPHPEIPMSGASPDGYVGADGLVEFKVPRSHTHLDTLLGQSIPQKYILQMSWQMACTGRTWCDFVSYDPRMPEEMRLFVQRLERSQPLIADIHAHVVAFLREVDDTVANLTQLYRR